MSDRAERKSGDISCYKTFFMAPAKVQGTAKAAIFVHLLICVTLTCPNSVRTKGESVSFVSSDLLERRNAREKSLATVGGGTLAVALSANLTALGWTCLPYQRSAHGERVAGALLLAEWEERPRDLVAEFVASGVLVVIIGSLREPQPLIAAVDAGAATVVDPDLPFAELLATVVTALATGIVRRQELLCALRSRQRDEELLARLTRRERDVLAALARGHTAGRIASDKHLSLATVRSHICSITHKLEVSSQLTAVAIARRGDRRLNLTDVQIVHQ